MHIFIHGRRVARTVYIYYRLLVSATLLGVGRRDRCSSRLSPDKNETFDFYPLLFIFTRCISTPWMFAFSGFSAVSDLDIHLRDPILRVILRINVSNVTGGGSEGVRDYLADFLSLAISAQSDEVFFPPDIIGGLRYCRRGDLLFRSCMMGFFGILLVPKRFPVFLGIRNSLRDCSAHASNVLGILLPAFFYRCSETKKVSWALLPALLQAYFGGRLYSPLCRGGVN